MYKATRDYENLQRAVYEGVEPYDLPIVPPCYECDIPEGNWIGFNYAASCRKDRDKTGVHFFLDDYQFVRIWQKPEMYARMLSDFGAVIAPDFSMFTDFPRAIQIYNAYRSRWLTKLFAESGVKVVPCINWSDSQSFKWCFEGMPTNSVVALSSVGTQKNVASRKAFRRGYDAMIERLNPSKIILIGQKPNNISDDNLCVIMPFHMRFEKND